MSSGDKKNNKVHVGYKFYLSLLYSLCHGPVDKIWGIWVENKSLLGGGTINADETKLVNKPELFGKQQGGIKGNVTLLSGTTTQSKPSFMTQFVGSVNSAYRGVCSLILDDTYLGNNPYLKPWSIRVQRILKRVVNGSVVDQWYADKAVVYTSDGSTKKPSAGDTLPLITRSSSVCTIAEDSLGNEIEATDKFCYGMSFGNQGTIWQIDSNGDCWEIDIETMVGTQIGSNLPTTGFYHGYWKDYGIHLFSNSSSNYNQIQFYNNSGQQVGTSGLNDSTWDKYYTWSGSTKTGEVGHQIAGGHQGRSYVLTGDKLVSTGVGFGIPVTFIQHAAASPYVDTSSLKAFVTNNGLSVLYPRSNTSRVPGAFKFGYGTATWLGGNGVSYSATHPIYLDGKYDEAESGETSSEANARDGVPDDQDWRIKIVDETVYSDSGFLFVCYNNEYAYFVYHVVRISDGGREHRIRKVPRYGNVETESSDYPLTFYTEFELTDDRPISLNQLTYGAIGAQLQGSKCLVHILENNSTPTPDNYGVAVLDVEEGECIQVYETPSDDLFGDSIVYKDFYVTRSQDTWVKVKFDALTSSSGGLDMNPAHIIRECLTDQQWGLGFGDSDIDDTAFTNCADTLYNEGFGLSIAWGSQSPVEDFIGKILKHIDAVLYVDRTTGKFVLKLIRDDYATPPELTDVDIVEVTEFDRIPESELINSVTVTYNDRDKRSSVSLSVNDIAAIRQYGDINSTTLSFPGVYSTDLASRIANRELRSLGTPQYNGQIILNRKSGNTFNVGDVFTVNSAIYPELAGQTYRVMEITFNDGDDNSVTINFRQDVFRLDDTGSVVANDPYTNTYDDSSVKYASDTNVYEMDWYHYVQGLGEQDAADNLAYNNLVSAALFSVGSLNGNPYAPDIYVSDPTNPFSPYTLLSSADTRPIFTLVEPLPPFVGEAADNYASIVEVELTSGYTLFTQGYNSEKYGTVAYVDNEMVLVTEVTTDAFNKSYAKVIRGLADTQVVYHAVGTKINVFGQNWEASASGLDVDLTDRIAGDTVTYAFASYTNDVVADPDAAPKKTVTFTGRIGKPWSGNGIELTHDPATGNTLNSYSTWAPYYSAGDATVSISPIDREDGTALNSPGAIDSQFTTGQAAGTELNLVITDYLITEGAGSGTEQVNTTVVPTGLESSIDFTGVDFTTGFRAAAAFAKASITTTDTVNSVDSFQDATLTIVNPEFDRADWSALTTQFFWADARYYPDTVYDDYVDNAGSLITDITTDPTYREITCSTGTSYATSGIKLTTTGTTTIGFDGNGLPMFDNTAAGITFDFESTGTDTKTYYIYSLADGAFQEHSFIATNPNQVSIDPDITDRLGDFQQLVVTDTELNYEQKMLVYQTMLEGLVTDWTQIWYGSRTWLDGITWTE